MTLSSAWVSSFDRQFSRPHSQWFLQNLKKVGKNLLNKCKNIVFGEDENLLLVTYHDKGCNGDIETDNDYKVPTLQ